MKKAVALVALLAVAIVGYVAAGPHLTLHQIKRAIKEQDSEKLAQNIDFPILRQNVKEQLNVIIMKQTFSQMGENPFAALALDFVSKLIDGMVDSFVTPPGLANLMEGKKPQQEATTEGSEAIPAQSIDEKRELFKDARYTYDSTSKFSVWVTVNEGEKITGEKIRFVLTRDGLKWKLSNIVIPIKNYGDIYHDDCEVSSQEKQELKNDLDADAARGGVAGTHPEPQLYQVTGSVLGLTNDVITVKKYNYEIWEVGQNKGTKVNGRLTIGSRVTIKYQLLATCIGLKRAQMDTPSSRPRSYQVTGPLVKLNDEVITVAKGNEQWEMRRNRETKIIGQLVIGSRVTILYKMSAMSIDVK